MGILYNHEQLETLLRECVTTTEGALAVHSEALKTVCDPRLRVTWRRNIDSFLERRAVLRHLVETHSFDTDTASASPGFGELQAKMAIQNIRLARQLLSPATTEIVAAEWVCVVVNRDAENWRLIHTVATHCGGATPALLREACLKLVRPPQNELDVAGRGCRRLWREALGLANRAGEKQTWEQHGTARIHGAHKIIVDAPGLEPTAFADVHTR